MSAMPIVTRFVNGVMEIKMLGVITVSDLEEHTREVAEIEAQEPVTPNRVMDLREGEAGDVRFGNIHGIAEMRTAAKLKNPIKTAILAASPVQFGLARTFQMLNDNPQITFGVFRDETEARAWLAKT